VNRKIPRLLAAAVVLGIVIALGCWVYFGDTVFRQARHMKMTQTYLPAITNAVHSHPELEGIRVGVYTGKDNCFLVAGMVETDKQLSVLESVVGAAKPPGATVIYSVNVLERYLDAKP